MTASGRKVLRVCGCNGVYIDISMVSVDVLTVYGCIACHCLFLSHLHNIFTYACQYYYYICNQLH